MSNSLFAPFNSSEEHDKMKKQMFDEMPKECRFLTDVFISRLIETFNQSTGETKWKSE